jgi:hypothetical protein
MNTPSFSWAIIIIVSVAGTGVLVFGDIIPPLRTLAVFWFLLVCPGMAYVPLLPVKDALTQWTLAIGLSLGTGAAVATSMLYLGYWTFHGILLVLMAISIIGAVLQIKSAIAAKDATAVPAK